MKIAIITCHDVYNYGASLQAFALQEHLSSFGNDVSIIDYQPEYLKTAYSFWNLPAGPENDKFRNNVILHFLLSLKMVSVRFATWRRVRPFRQFKKQYLNCTEKYIKFDRLVSRPPVADIYVAGSDQIWNTYLYNGLDPAFYLAFGSSDVRRVAYAASFAMPSLPAAHTLFVKKHLANFDAISVRESTGLSILQSIGVDGCVVADPVFLLSKEDWEKKLCGSRCYSTGYILVYCLRPGNRVVFDRAAELSRRYGLPVKVVEGILPVHEDFEIIHSAGPVEFVQLFRDASFVVTDSFHGTAFSLIFEKPFNVFHRHSDSSRISDLLHTLGLDCCLNPEDIVEDFDWVEVKDRLRHLVQESKDYISQSMYSE